MRITSILFSLLALIILNVQLSAQTAVELKDVEMTISGTSTLHDWTSEVTEVNAKGSVTLADNKIQDVTSLTVTIPVEGIKSTKGKVMDNKTYEAFKSDKNPTITYQLVDVKSVTQSGSAFQLTTTGKLTMAGTTKTIELPVKAVVLDDGTVQFTGSKKLKMTDYNMEQPTAMLGTIKTGDEVTVNFKVTLAGTKS